MKLSSMSVVIKFILIVVAIVAMCALCFFIIGASNSGKDLASNAKAQFYGITSKGDEYLASTYDGNSILGSELVSLIKDTIEDKAELAIVVRSLGGSRVDYNYTYSVENNSICAGGTTAIQESKAQDSYINRTSLFQCEVKKDDNGNPICLWFEQVP